MIPGIRFMLDKVNESTLGYQYLGSAFSAVESGFSPMQYLLFMNSRKAFDPADILAGQLPSSA